MKSNSNHYAESTPLLESKRHSDGSYQSNMCREPSDRLEEYQDEVKTSQPRQKETYLTDLQTMMHLLKASIGIGILGLPRALMNAGILVGPLLLLTLAVTTIHCMHLLVKCSKRLCIETEKSALSYGEVADECVKRVLPEYNTLGSTIVNLFLCITQFGACTAYVLFMAENLHDGMAELDAVHMKKKLYIPIILPFLLMFCLVKNLKSLFWMSWFANFLMAIVFVSIFVYLFGHLQDPSELDLFSSWGDLPLSFGTATYAFEAIPIILPLENKIKNSDHFPRVINISMVIVTSLYFSMAIFGYMTFQDKCKGSVTLNLPNTDYYSTVKFLVSVAIFCTYFIQIYVFFGIVEPIMFRWISHEKYHTLALVLLRLTTICVTCGLAAVIPHVNDIVCLVGASGAAFLAFVFPTIFHWIVYSKELGKMATIKNVIVITFGVVGSITGTYASLRNIIEDK